MSEYLSVTEAADLLAVSRRTVWRLIGSGTLRAILDPIDRRAKLVDRMDVERLTQYRSHRVALTVRELGPGRATHDLALQVRRAETEEDVQSLLGEAVEFFRDYPIDPREVGVALTPEQAARIQMHHSIGSLDDPKQRSLWLGVLERHTNSTP